MKSLRPLILAGLASLFFANSAHAQSWYLTGKSENDQLIYFVDLDTIVDQGQNVKAWVWVLEKEPSDGIDSFKLLSLYNCKEDKFKLLNDVVFLRGTFVSSSDYRDARWKPVVPGSMTAGVMEVLCKRAKYNSARNYKSSSESTIRKTWWNQW